MLIRGETLLMEELEGKLAGRSRAVTETICKRRVASNATLKESMKENWLVIHIKSIGGGRSNRDSGLSLATYTPY